jgi:hypothetical protein
MRRAAAMILAIVMGAPALAAPPPPPATMDARGIDAWREAHIDAAGDWLLMHADGSALSYAGGPNGLSTDKDGFLRVDVRREYYRPVRVGPQASRSNLQTWVLDCELRRLRVTAMNFYVQNNMKGGGFRKTAEEPSWITIAEENNNSPVFDRICASRPASAR